MRLLTTLSLLLVASLAHADSFSQLNKKIKQAGAQWVAGPTSVSHLSFAEMRAMLDSSLDTHPEVQFEVPESSISTFAVATSFDWRNKDGKNYMSPIRQQGSCGSCLAFAAVATLETQYRIAQNKSYRLSPQFLFSCGGGICKKGWYPEEAAQFLLKTGTPDESCMPYSSGTGRDIACNRACRDSNQRSVKTSSYSRPTGGARDLAALREALKKGPLVTTMSVYADFMNYRRGIYKRVSKSYVSGHAIVLIGYNDKERYFVIRNSWGTAWGESGYARISYDDTSGIGASTWKYEVPQTRVFDLPLLNAQLDPQGSPVAAERGPAGITFSPLPDLKLSRPVQAKAVGEAIELTLQNSSGYVGEVLFHQIHKGKEKIVPVTLNGPVLKIHMNPLFLAMGDWEIFFSVKDGTGRTYTSDKQIITIEP